MLATSDVSADITRYSASDEDFEIVPCLDFLLTGDFLRRRRIWVVTNRYVWIQVVLSKSEKAWRLMVSAPLRRITWANEEWT